MLHFQFTLKKQFFLGGEGEWGIELFIQGVMDLAGKRKVVDAPLYRSTFQQKQTTR